MRLAPKSLAGQLTLLLLLALAVAQGVAVALFAWERIEALREAHRDNAVARVATVVRLLRDTPPALHDAVIAGTVAWVELILAYRPDLSARTRPGPTQPGGETALDYARRRRKPALIRLLEAAQEAALEAAP